MSYGNFALLAAMIVMLVTSTIMTINSFKQVLSLSSINARIDAMRESRKLIL